jgi:hypothetical protein
VNPESPGRLVLLSRRIKGLALCPGWLQAGLQQLTEAGAFLLAHSLEGLTGARPPEDGVPEVVEVVVIAFYRRGAFSRGSGVQRKASAWLSFQPRHRTRAVCPSLLATKVPAPASRMD